MATTPTLPRLHTLPVGGVAKAELLQRLHQAGVALNPLAQALFAHARFHTSTQASAQRVLMLSAAQLGLPQGGHFADVVAAAQAQGHRLCPLELGPHLRLALTDQPEGLLGQPATPQRAPPGAITVASAPLAEDGPSDGNDLDDDLPQGFYLRVMAGVPWLRGYRSWAGHVWAPEDVFAFIAAPGAPGTADGP